MSGKFVGYVRLLDACGEAGCPVCRCVTGDSRQHLEAILYEHVTDPQTRRRIRSSWGFCNWHTWMLLEIPGARSSAAIVFEDLLGRLVERVGRDVEGAPAERRWPRALRRPVRRPAPFRESCPACENSVEAEHRYLETLLAGDGDPELQLAYARSDGLCGPHLLRAMGLAGASAGRSWLAARTMAKWARFRDDLGRFVAKHDHRNREPFTADEAAACERAFEVLSGARGVFGNDRTPR